MNDKFYLIPVFEEVELKVAGFMPKSWKNGDPSAFYYADVEGRCFRRTESGELSHIGTINIR